MSDFKVIEVVNSNTLKVSPSWKFILKEERTFVGNKIVVRGLGIANDPIIKARLETLLLNRESDIKFVSPELINSENDQDAIVSCSVYLSSTNILYYFPEFVHKD